MIKEERRKKARRIIKELKKLFPHAGIVLRYGDPWELLVAVILSAQCTDKKVNEVTEKLFKKYRTLEDYVKASKKEFEKDIYQTGFYRAKAKHILASAKMIKHRFAGTIPRTMEQMMEFPGVARKTANVVLSNAYGVVEGVAVDTHVKRLSKVLGLTDHDDPNKIERDLMDSVPRKEWMNVTFLLIEYGRRYCTAKRHDHAQCPLSYRK